MNRIKYMTQFLAALVLVAAVSLLSGCTKNLNQSPKATATNSAVFGTLQGLQLYAYSFYDGLASAGTTVRGDDQYAGADYGARSSAPTYLQDGAFSSRQASGWTWTTLRNINYFLANVSIPNPAIKDADRANYMGLARFFRAYFYYGMVQQFGNVPWVGQTLSTTDSTLYAPRSDRGLVMDSVLADLNYAIANISASSDPTASLITKWVAYGLKSRICLFEGTFRRYQSDSVENATLRNTASTWLQDAASAAKAIMDSSGFTLNQAGGASLAYRNLFISTSPVNTEVMLSDVLSSALSVLNDANWYYTSSTYGTKYSFTRDFINTYLNIDGTPFTDLPHHDTMTFLTETQNRDGRLAQTIRAPGYNRISSGKTVAAPPVFSYTNTGYQPIKWCLDDTYYDGSGINNNSVCLMRYAEILLNYAEATQELKNYGIGSGLTGSDWAKTIGALRTRAGVTANLGLPTVADPYIHAYYNSTDTRATPAPLIVDDPVLLEIRRERGIELCLEGFRFADLTRWRLGDLLQRSWNGMYVPALNVPMDLNGDGIQDVCFYQGTQPSNISGVTYLNVSPTVNGTTNFMQLSNGTSGEIHWLDNTRQWHDYKYFYPIPYSELLLNPNLGQNPTWQ